MPEPTPFMPPVHPSGPISSVLSEAPIVAHVVRNGVVESVHRGTVVATTPDGQVDWAVGDPSGPILPRSSLKPLQAVAMVRAGLDVPPPLLAVACASHSGERFHIDAAQRMLGDAGLDASYLQNTPSYPYAEREHAEWLRDRRAPSALAQNCSGKHAAMLATCRAAGWDVATYRDPDHPLQRLMAQVIEELTGEQISAVTVDGCGAPAFAVTLTGLARSFGRLAASTDAASRRVADAMGAHPAYVGGTGRDVSALLAEVAGSVAKDGAEAVYAVGLRDGRGLALKIADGGTRAKALVLADALDRLEVDCPETKALMRAAPVLGHGAPVGAIVSTLSGHSG